MIRMMTIPPLVLAFAVAMLAAGPGAAAQMAACDDFSSQAMAQFALHLNPGLAATLDPDGNGIACDHDDAGADLQLPPQGAPSPTPSGQDTGTGVDAVDQQPTGPGGISTSQIPTPQGDLQGRLGGDRAGWEAMFGAPIDPREGSTPSIVVASFAPPPGATDLITLWYDGQTFIILVTAETPWTPDQGAQALTDLLPTDILSIPQGEVLPDGSILIPMFSDQLAAEVSPDVMIRAGAPGVPGDLYVLVIPDATGRNVAELELGIGNGDNVREDVQAEPTPAI